MRLTTPFLLALTVLIAAGCASTPKQPEVLSAGVIPSVLQPGDSAIVQAEFQDVFEIIDRVEGVIPDDPTVVFKLRDNGVAPDEAAGDNIWTLRVDVPFNAPPGEFTLEVTAYDSDGERILVHDENNEAAPLAVDCTLRIQYEE